MNRKLASRTIPSRIPIISPKITPTKNDFWSNYYHKKGENDGFSDFRHRSVVELQEPLAGQLALRHQELDIRTAIKIELCNAAEED